MSKNLNIFSTIYLLHDSWMALTKFTTNASDHEHKRADNMLNIIKKLDLSSFPQLKIEKSICLALSETKFEREANTFFMSHCNKSLPEIHKVQKHVFVNSFCKVIGFWRRLPKPMKWYWSVLRSIEHSQMMKLIEKCLML